MTHLPAAANGQTAHNPSAVQALSAAWGPLASGITDRYQRSFLNQFGLYCSTIGIEPKDVTDQILADFEAYSVAIGKPPSRAKQLRRDVTKALNGLALSQYGLPDLKLGLVDSRQNQSISPNYLPPSLLSDAKAFIHRTGGNGLFDARKTKPLRPTTQKDRLHKICQLVTVYVNAGGQLSALKSLKDLAQPEIMELILGALWQDGKGRENGHNYNRARLLRLIAEHWAYVSPEALEAFKTAESRFRPKKMGMTESNQKKLRPFLDDAHCQTIVSLPSRVMAKLDATNPSILDAVLAQSAVAAAILQNAPMRMRNLASLNLNRHIHRVSDSVCHIVIPSSEVKNEQDLDFPLGKTAIRLLNLYVKVHRPLLLKGMQDNGSLFISWNGVQKTEAALSAQITKFIKEQAGYHLNPHAFRHLIGLIFLRTFPGEYEPVRQLLGHKDIRTTINFYVGLETQDSFKRLDMIMDRHRGEEPHASF